MDSPRGCCIFTGVNPFVARCALALLGFSVCRAEPSAIRIWPSAAPGEKGEIAGEGNLTKPTDKLIAGKSVIRLSNVSDPTITVYAPPRAANTWAAVLVCPGGGYNALSMDLEGTEVCTWLNSIGVTGVLLKYRVPRRAGQPPYAAPLQDAQRAMGLVRSHAADWGIDPKRIGILGFSAGGDLAAVLCAKHGKRTYPWVDAADDVSCRPDFQILVYPAYLEKDEEGYGINPEVAVSGGTPPTFIAVAQDDVNYGRNSLVYAMELYREKVPMELHVYPTGSHGFGLRSTKDFATTWPQRALDWMRSRGLLEPN